jgi:hypothetical protein
VRPPEDLVVVEKMGKKKTLARLFALGSEGRTTRRDAARGSCGLDRQVLKVKALADPIAFIHKNGAYFVRRVKSALLPKPTTPTTPTAPTAALHHCTTIPLYLHYYNSMINSSNV